MKRFAMAVLLTCVFTSGALAGDIPTVPAPPPSSAASAETDGDMGNFDLSDEITDEIVLTIFGIFAG